MSQEIEPRKKDVREKLLLVDSSSVAVTIFYAMGGLKFLQAELIDRVEAEQFLQDVAKATVNSVVRRVSIDGYTGVRMALESPPWMPVWRYGVYPDYKYARARVKRPRIAGKLQGLLIDAAEVEGVPTLFSPGLEADDVLAIMLYRIQDRLDHTEVHIWSQDRDLHQLLIHPNVKMLGKRGVLTTKKEAEEYWGHDVRAIPLLKALAGDKSDNITGVPGIGRKTAAKIIRHTPHKKSSLYSLDESKLPKSKKLQILDLRARIQKYENLCTLRTVGELLPGRDYGRPDGEKE